MKEGPQNISIADFDYELPLERIAQYPLDHRDSSKLLVHRHGSTTEALFQDLPDLLPANSTLVFNETRVIHARLLFRKPEGSQVEVFCLEPHGTIRDHQLAFQATGSSEWSCLVGNSKRWKQGPLTIVHDAPDRQIKLNAERLERSDSHSIIRFSWEPGHLAFADVLEKIGKMPLPPYISRAATTIDDDHYQTIYARQDGSVAAPTAGLHFTPELMDRLEGKGHSRLNFILHVGAGTFRPVTSEKIGDHEMHQEQVRYDLDNLKKLYSSLDGPLALVGTTSVRLMESLFWQGVKMIKGMTGLNDMVIRQWDPYQIGNSHGISRIQALEAIITAMEREGVNSLSGETKLIIAPGYRFHFPDALITNFHQPRSTLLLLIAAFIGDDWKNAYQFALDHNFRFLSYGDSCLFFRK